MPKKLFTLLLTLLLATGILAASTWFLGTNASVMLHLMQTHAPAETTGLPADEYPAVAAMIASYLAGETDTFQHAYSVNGTEVLAFNQVEQQHMADVQGLFRLDRQVMVTNLCLSMALVALTVILWGHSALRKMLLAAGIASFVAVAMLGIAAWLNFEALFILFHRIAFTNDLWLLDPRTDLLIRLMPTDFFVAYAAYIGLAWAAGMTLVTLLSLWLTKERNA